jgi:hypothetical protein
VFVLVGEEYLRENLRRSVILTSPDGLTWTFRREKENEYLPSILFGNGRFVAWGFENGTNLVSTDGITWDYVPGPQPRKFLNGLFVSFPNPTNFVTSLDAVSWTTNSFGTNTNAIVQDITFGKETFVTIVYNYHGPFSPGLTEIWQSDPITNSPPAAPALAVAAYPGLTITGTVGARYRIEYRDALAANGAWNVLTNVVLPSSPWLYFDREAFAHPGLFYRAAAE